MLAISEETQSAWANQFERAKGERRGRYTEQRSNWRVHRMA